MEALEFTWLICGREKYSQQLLGKRSFMTAFATTTTTTSTTNTSSPGAKPNTGLIVCRWLHCERQFRNFDQLYYHLCEDHVGRKSTGNLCLKCCWQNCQVVKTKRDHLTSHLRVHVANRPFFCQVRPCLLLLLLIMSRLVDLWTLV